MNAITKTIISYVCFLLVGFAVGWLSKKQETIIKENEALVNAQEKTALNVENSLWRDMNVETKNNQVKATATETKTKVITKVKEVTDAKNCSNVYLDGDTVRLLNNQRNGSSE